MLEVVIGTHQRKISNYLKELVDEGLVKEIFDPTALMLRMVDEFIQFIRYVKAKKILEEIQNRKGFWSIAILQILKNLKKLQKNI